MTIVPAMVSKIIYVSSSNESLLLLHNLYYFRPETPLVNHMQETRG